MRGAIDHHGAVWRNTRRFIQEGAGQNLNGARSKILFGDVLCTTVGAYHHQEFTVGADFRILVLRAFPRQTLCGTAAALIL